MARYRKIVWTEGMHLLQHHMQQLDRYHESLLDFRIKSVLPFYWGLTDLEINREGVENGTFELLSCHGILTEGTLIDIPETDEAPSSRAIEEHFEPSMEKLGVYLAVPSDRPGSANFRLEENGSSRELRYFVDFVRVVDENTGESEQEISIAKKNVKLLFTGESFDGYSYIKIAELGWTSNGTVTLREEYIPPCLTISASPRIMNLLRRLRESLSAKSNEFSQQYQQRAGHNEFESFDMFNLWHLQTINTFTSQLNHFYRSKREHPEILFRFLASFAGALTAFSGDIRPIDLPDYNHDTLERSFGELYDIIQSLLPALVPMVPPPEPEPEPEPEPPYRFISPSSVRESIYEYVIEDYLLAPSYKFYVAVKGEGDQRELIDHVQRRVKIASADGISGIIRFALPGIPLKYLLNPPTAIPVKSGYSYFALDLQSNLWQDVQQSKSLAVYIPELLEEIELQLIALEEG
jgi:type VI secretion system protein ImpJ